MPTMRRVLWDSLRTSRTLLALAMVVSACGDPVEPAMPSPEMALSAMEGTGLAKFAPGLVEETERLLLVVGDGFAEQPLRVALQALRDQVTANPDEMAALLDESRAQVSAYLADPGNVDLSELDAIELLITSVDEVMAANYSDANSV